MINIACRAVPMQVSRHIRCIISMHCSEGGAQAAPTHLPSREAWVRTWALVDTLLTAMEAALQEDEPEAWKKLFGTKDSVIVTLQKLVQLLADLEAHVKPVQQEADTPECLSDEEWSLLIQWLKETRLPEED